MHGDTAAPPLVLAINSQRIGKMTEDEPLSEWRRFNDGFTNIAWGTGQLLEHIRTGHSFCSSHAHIRRDLGRRDKNGNIIWSSYRCLPNWMETSVAILDFDRAALKLRDLFEQDEFVHNYACIGYNTTSSTEETPRYRVIFSLPKAIRKIENQRRLLEALSWKYSTVDRMSRNPVMAYAGNHTSSFAHVEQANNRLTMNAVTDLLQRHEAHLASIEKHCHDFPEHSESQWTARDIAEMLSYIPKKQDYLDWMRILIAVHSVFPDETGIELVKSWSYYKPGEIENKWQSFGSTRVTIGTLIAAAMERGYEPPWRRARTVSRVIMAARRR